MVIGQGHNREIVWKLTCMYTLYIRSCVNLVQMLLLIEEGIKVISNVIVLDQGRLFDVFETFYKL